MWYAALIFALVSIILGAQQTIIMPEASDGIDPLIIKQRLLASDSFTPRPNRLMLFVWQSPLMCISSSIMCFLAGLTSVVLSPLAQDPRWNEAAKVGRQEHDLVIKQNS